MLFSWLLSKTLHRPPPAQISTDRSDIFYISCISIILHKQNCHSEFTTSCCWWLPSLAVCTSYPEIFTLHSQFRSLYSYCICHLHHIYNIQKEFHIYDACVWQGTIFRVFVTFVTRCHTMWHGICGFWTPMLSQHVAATSCCALLPLHLLKWPMGACHIPEIYAWFENHRHFN